MRCLLVVSGLLLAGSAFAYKPLPVKERDFAKPTPDGKFLLVMLRTRDTELAKKYPQPGLYPVDNPRNPVWTLDWSAEYETSVFASGDRSNAGHVVWGDPVKQRWLYAERPDERFLVYPVHISPKTTALGKVTAFFLYRDGKLNQRLTFDDLFDSARFSDLDCHFGPALVISSMDDPAGLVVIETKHEDGGWQTATVNFRTGEVVNRASSPVTPAAQPDRPTLPPSNENWTWLWVGLATGTLILVAALTLFFRRRK
jgi:hypothetical protein